MVAKTEVKTVTVDADGHIMEPPDLWENYLEPEYRDRAIRLRKDENGLEYLEIDGKKSKALQGGTLGTLGAIGDPDEVERFYTASEETTFENGTPPGAVDPHERIKVMDKDGIDIAFLYPTIGICWEQECLDPKLTAAYCRAYNNWLFDFCKPYPDRLKPIAHISLLDMDEAIKELKRVAKLGANGVFLFGRPPWLKERPFGHRDNDRYWAELQDMEIPVGIHPVVGPEYPGDHMYPGSCPFTDVLWWDDVLFSLDVQFAFTNFIYEGVFERFPRLKTLILETGAGWLPAWLDRMDHLTEVYRFKFRDRSLKPSEYFQRQCWVSMDPDDHTAPWIASQLGADKIFWASDYPHTDAYPDPVNELKSNIKELPEEDQRKIIGENALKVYNVVA